MMEDSFSLLTLPLKSSKILTISIKVQDLSTITVKMHCLHKAASAFLTLTFARTTPHTDFLPRTTLRDSHQPKSSLNQYVSCQPQVSTSSAGSETTMTDSTSMIIKTARVMKRDLTSSVPGKSQLHPKRSNYPQHLHRLASNHQSQPAWEESCKQCRSTRSQRSLPILAILS